MRKYLIERDIPKVGSFGPNQLCDTAKTSKAALTRLGPQIQWVQSYVTADKIFCIYLAKDEALIERHAELSGFPVNKVTEVKEVIDLMTAENWE
jgi:Protein of unknown function (DUF4242)